MTVIGTETNRDFRSDYFKTRNGRCHCIHDRYYPVSVRFQSVYRRVIFTKEKIFEKIRLRPDSYLYIERGRLKRLKRDVRGVVACISEVTFRFLFSTDFKQMADEVIKNPCHRQGTLPFYSVTRYA